MLPAANGAYAAWSEWLAAFGTGTDPDASSLPAVDPTVLGGAVAARLAERSAAALTARLRLWSEHLQRDLDRARDVAAVREAMRAARRRLEPIRGFAGSRLLFSELRIALEDAVAEALAEAQSSLEAHAERQRLAVGETLLRAVRDQPVDTPIQLDLPPERRSSKIPPDHRRPIVLP